MGYIKNGNVLMLGGGKDGLTYPASGSSPALVLDASGNGNNGVNSGAVLVDDHLGNSDGALLIDASGKYVNLGDINLSSFYGASGKGTISIRFKYVAEGRLRTLISKYVTDEFNFYINEYNNFVAALFGNVQINLSIPSASFTSGNWYHLAVVYDNTQTGNAKLKAYLNSIYQSLNVTNAASFTGINNGTGNLLVGNRAGSGLTTAYYNEAICDVAIHNRPILSGEVTTLYNGGTVSDGLVFDLPMNRLNCRTNTGIDLSGNGNVITNNGATPTADHNGRANRGFKFIATNSNHFAYGTNVVRNKAKLTFENSFKKTTASETIYLISNYVSTSDLFNVLVDATGIQITLGTTSIYARFNFTQDTAYHYAQFIFDGSGATDADKVKLVLDGTERTLTFSGTIPIATPNTNGTMYKARQATTYSNFETDWEMIYDTNLSVSSCIKNKKYWDTH